MDRPCTEQRSDKRTCFEPSDTGHRLEAVLSGKSYTFTVLNICRGGIGMLIRKDQADALESLKPGTRISMDYSTPKGTLALTVETRHVTPITSGPFQGAVSVGFSMSV
jgi:hypothetical protein